MSRRAAAINQSVHASSPSARYSTLFCGRVDSGGRRLTYVNAGQCAPMLVRRREDGVTVERLTTGGTPVGLLPISRYEEAAVELEPGDLLACFSDGISEATNAQGEVWEEPELEQLLRGAAGLSASEVTELLVQAADGFTGEAEQADDMTVVVLRVR